MLELKYQTWKQVKTFEQGWKIVPYAKLHPNTLFCFTAFDFISAVNIWASPKTTFETKSALVAHCFEGKKLAEKVIHLQIRSERWFYTANSTTSK